MTELENTDITDEEKELKIEELREIIANAQETISSATQILAVLQGTTPEDMPINKTSIVDEDENAFYGFFDGQIMIGDDGKQYPVPANYASKSKLVEGDKLKLTITPDNKFVYKQIGPVQRNYLIGTVQRDERGNFTIQTPDKNYRVLLAAATYFKIEAGDEVTLIVPQGKITVWGAIENVLQKSPAAPVVISSTAPVATTPTQEQIQPPVAMPTPPVIPEAPEPELDISEEIHKSPEATQEVTAPPEKELTMNQVPEDAKPKLSALERLEREMEEEAMISKPAPASTEDAFTATTQDTDDWAADIEQLKQEAGIAASSSK